LEARPPQRPDNRKVKEAEELELAALVDRQPDMTLEELAEALNTKVSVPTIFRATERLGLTFKKSPSMPPSRSGRM
jgi:transposase